MDQEQMGKHTMQCFRHATSHLCVFNMSCAGHMQKPEVPRNA